MGALTTTLLEALAYMPEHRKKNTRTRSVTLDTLFEESRSFTTLSSSALDFILMGYRYHHAFQDFLREFNPKGLSPKTLEDLGELIFAALLTRDKTPAHALVSEGVEAAKRGFGPHTGGVMNALLRKCTRELDALKQKLAANPSAILGPELNQRWAPQDDLRMRIGRQVLARPEPGIWSFNRKLEFGARGVDDFANVHDTLQAMDPGSWLLLDWVQRELTTRKVSAPRLLDACAAPGGKCVGLALRLPHAKIWATDSDYKRIEKLRANLQRWNLDLTVHSQVAAWGTPEATADVAGPFDVVLADLPCSGSGTLHTRPDLLQENLPQRIAQLMPIQTKILQALLPKIQPGGLFFVSVCSVDPEEIAHVSKVLGVAPAFSSFAASAESVEGITGWLKSC
ncbi:MAG: hypothetical protein JST16_12685 [Bdellovibrionales bacterium]|nr:hypothetical protein [Bdellovibrionales bacterium]